MQVIYVCESRCLVTKFQSWYDGLGKLIFDTTGSIYFYAKGLYLMEYPLFFKPLTSDRQPSFGTGCVLLTFSEVIYRTVYGVRLAQKYC